MRKYIMALGGVASLLTLGLAGAQASVAAPAATPACDFFCFNLSSLLTGDTVIQNAYIPGGNGVAVTAKPGTRLDMKLGNDKYPQEDFTQDFTGLEVNDFCTDFPLPDSQEFLSTSYVCIHYGADPVYEANWSPYGNQSGLCAGVAVANTGNQHVTLQPCGVDTRTMWIADEINEHLGYTPWVNGSDLHFTHPLVLTEDQGTKNPQNQLFLDTLNLLTGNFVDNSQMFIPEFGPFV